MNPWEAVNAVADAVLAEIMAGVEAGDLALPACTPRRMHDTTLELRDANVLHVDAFAEDFRVKLVGRGPRAVEVDVTVAVRKKTDTQDSQNIVDLMTLTGAIHDYLSPTSTHTARPLSTLDNTAWVSTEPIGPYIPEHLEEWQQFTAIFVLTYRIVVA